MNRYTFEIFKIKGLDCYQTCFIHLVNYYRSEYNLCFLDMFRFRFQGVKSDYNTISQRLYNSNKHDLERYAKEFYGTQIHLVNFTKEIVKDIVFENLKKTGPILVSAPANSCVWLPSYETQQVYHSFIIINIDNGICQIADPFYFTQIQNVSFEALNICSMYIMKINRVNLKSPNRQFVIVDKARKEIGCQLKSRDFDEFILAFEQMNTLSEEYPDQRFYENIHWVTGLDKELGFTMAGSRDLYADFLFHISDYARDIHGLYSVARRIKQVKNLWIILRNRLLHCYITNQYDKQKSAILTMLKNIYAEETNIRKDVLCCL